MTEDEKRSLRSYLKHALEPSLKHDEKCVTEWTAKEAGATGLDLDIAVKMRRWHEGRVSATTYAINEFKDLFPEELQTGKE